MNCVHMYVFWSFDAKTITSKTIKVGNTVKSIEAKKILPEICLWRGKVRSLVSWGAKLLSEK